MKGDKFPMRPDSPWRKDGETSLYADPCPKCKAPAWYYCVLSTGRRSSYPHKERNPRPQNTPLPDLRAWWREQVKLEAKARA